jgi:hypothetical protein
LTPINIDGESFISTSVTSESVLCLGEASKEIGTVMVDISFITAAFPLIVPSISLLATSLDIDSDLARLAIIGSNIAASTGVSTDTK